MSYADEIFKQNCIDIIEYDFSEVYRMAAEGQLVDAKTIAALLMAKEQLGL